jgi:transcriptional regulator GlxA family with amidase domain
MENLNLSVYLVVTPGVLMLDYAGPAEALRMARDMGAPLTLYTCGQLHDVPTSLDTQLTGLEPLPQPLPPNSQVLITGNSHEREDYATPAAQQVVSWLQTAMRPVPHWQRKWHGAWCCTPGAAPTTHSCRPG